MALNAQKGGDSLSDKVGKVANKERQEEFVIAIPETVVNEGAVMIELLDALLAKVAVERVARFDDAAVEAEIFEVNALVICKLE